MMMETQGASFILKSDCHNHIPKHVIKTLVEH